MSGKLQILRFVVEEQEDVIYSNTNLAPEDVQAVGQYIINHIKKKYNSEQLTMRDIENQHYELDEIIEFSVSPIFITIPKRAEIQTFTTIKDRDNRTIYKFVENDGVKIEKYRQTKKTEEVRLELHTIQKMNANFEEVMERNKLTEENITKQMATVQVNNPMNFVQSAVEENKDDPPSPTFGRGPGLAPALPAKQYLGPRQKEYGGDGKSQSEFLKRTVENANPLGKKVELKAYTMEEVAAHNTDKDAWMIINQKIYDVALYLNYHPGGKAKLMLGVGKDGTALFNSYHPWVNALYLLEKYQVGFLKNVYSLRQMKGTLTEQFHSGHIK